MAKDNQKHAGGRPTKYEPEYCQEIIDFFSVEPTREVDVVTTFKNGTTKESTEERPNHIPFFADFADKIGVNGDTIVEWAKRHEEFSAAYMRAKALQKQHLITCGLLGLYNSKFAVFTAINITDMRDKQEHNIGGQPNNPIGLQALLPTTQEALLLAKGRVRLLEAQLGAGDAVVEE